MAFLNFERYLLDIDIKTGVDDLLVSGTAGTVNNLIKWNVDGDAVDANVAVNDGGVTTAELFTASKIISDLATKVGVAGDENISGIKTFISIPILPASSPTTDNQAVRKAYVDAIVAGAMILQGDWNASTNVPDISATTTTGYAWRVSVAGATDLGGITSWAVGDLAVKTATSWIKVNNEDIGAVWGNVTGTVSNQTDLQLELNAKQDNITVADSTSVDLTFASEEISAGIIVDGSTIEIDVGSGIRVKDEGITVEKLEANLTTPAIGRWYRGDGSWQEQASGVASVADTVTIDLEMAAGVITADVKDDSLTTAKTATTSKTGLDTKFVTGTPSASGYIPAWNSDFDLVDTAATAANLSTLVGGGDADALHGHATLASLTGVEELTNKTLTSPKVNENVVLTNTATKLNTVSLNKLNATAAPAVTDDSGDGYSPGSIWVDVTNDKSYICQDATSTAAVWTDITATGVDGGTL